ncbi:hypothetical protein D3C78_1553270 [compost metagenome]
MRAVRAAQVAQQACVEQGVMGDVCAGLRAERIVDLAAAPHVGRQAGRAEQLEQ